MQNDIASQKFPGIYWNTLSWEEPYPNGESPKEFFERIQKAWHLFSEQICNKNENVLLVTHSGVIRIILHLINNTSYSNQKIQLPIQHATLIELNYAQKQWEISIL